MTRYLSGSVLLALAASCLATINYTAQAQEPAGWSTVKGKVIYGGTDIPKQEPLKVDKDQAHCLAHGPILSEDWVVDPKTKGVKDVFVWLEPMDKDAQMPVNPKLKNRALKPVELNQPNCRFVPHVLAMEEGQTLIVKNPAPIPHNLHTISHPTKNPKGTVNFLMPPNSTFQLKDLKAVGFPVSVNCDIHPWMRASIRVFDHPYYAVTKEDGSFALPLAPAGEYRLFVWHPASGWMGGAKGRNGTPITIRAEGDTDVGSLKIQKK